VVPAIQELDAAFAPGTAEPTAGPTIVVVPTPAEVAATSSLPHVAGYEILGVLGRGGMGVVYKARHLRLKRVVALKMVLARAHAEAEQLARFRSEAEAAARLQHPNIVQIYEVGEQDGRPYFALEYVDGGSLAQHLAGAPLPAETAAALVETLARAMHYAHQQGVVHRDLKPANVLLQYPFSREPQVSADAALARGSGLNELIPKITDFGLAKQLQREAEATAPGYHTQTGMILGTPNYMSPEQALGQTKTLGPAVDVHALGRSSTSCSRGGHRSRPRPCWTSWNKYAPRSP
jgi:serine/threonine protein kinase